VHDESQFVAEIGKKAGHFVECVKKIPAVTHFALPFPHIHGSSDQSNKIFSFSPRPKDAFFIERGAERSTLCIGFPDEMRRWLSGYEGANESDGRLPAKYH
jgi:hypothetical protein